MFGHRWSLADIKTDKDIKVFSIFSCGGGSTMGYKRAGFRVIGNCEIDKQINDMYVKNHHPKYNYNMDARQFLKEDLPDELYHLDILDGSPPCSTFSMAGDREKAWNKNKAFREGQVEQRLDDLFFVFLDIVEKLKPKVVVAENVTGLLNGNAKGYVNEILKRFKELGYNVQIFRLNSAFMEVPQARERVFFIANNQGYDKLKLDFNYPQIYFGDVRNREPGRKMSDDTKSAQLLSRKQKGDRSLADINERLYGKHSMFNQRIIWDDEVCSTVTSNGCFYRACDNTYFTKEDFIAVQTFPYDYDFVNDSANNVQYVVGMSVPPNAMAHIANQIWEQWLKG